MQSAGSGSSEDIRKGVSTVRYVLRGTLTKICSICYLLWETILRIPRRKSKSRITISMTHFVSQH